MNGKNLQYWLLGAMFSLLLLFGGFIYSDVAQGQEKLAETVNTDRQRLSTLEAQYQDILRRLIRIEDKLDKIVVSQ